MEPMNQGMNSFNQYLENLLPGDEKQSAGSWEIDNKGVHFSKNGDNYQSSYKIQSALDKIKRDLESYARDFDASLKGGNPNKIERCRKQLESLQKLIEAKIQTYHEQHSGLIGVFKANAYAAPFGSIDQKKIIIFNKINEINQKILAVQDIHASPMLQEMKLLKNPQGKDRPLPVDPEPLAQILSYLPGKDFVNFSTAMSTIKESVVAEKWINEARKFGYDGNDQEEAKQYIKGFGKTLEKMIPYVSGLEKNIKGKDDIIGRTSDLLECLQKPANIEKIFETLNGSFGSQGKYRANEIFLCLAQTEDKSPMAAYFNRMPSDILIKFFLSAIKDKDQQTIDLILKTLISESSNAKGVAFYYSDKLKDLLLETLKNGDLLTSEFLLEKISEISWGGVSNLIDQAIQKGFTEFAKKLLDKTSNYNKGQLLQHVRYINSKTLKFLLENEVKITNTLALDSVLEAILPDDLDGYKDYYLEIVEKVKLLISNGAKIQSKWTMEYFERRHPTLALQVKQWLEEYQQRHPNG